jgi:hypothetical protein
MKIKALVLVSLLTLLICASQLSADEVGKVIFCASVDDKLNPVDIKEEFDTNQITALFNAPSDKKFNSLELVLSIYKQIEEGKQELIHRETKSINPQWNVLVLQDIPLPDVGNYTFTLTSADGNEVSTGLVSIKTKTVDKVIPEENKIQGTTLEALFNKYQQKAVKSD